jgi:hypothetical protein
MILNNRSKKKFIVVLDYKIHMNALLMEAGSKTVSVKMTT